MPDEGAAGGRQVAPPEPADPKVAAEILDRLDALPDERRREMMAVLYQHKGPLPDPATFAGYGAVYPDAPREILAMATRQHEHEIDMASRSLTSEISYRNMTLAAATAVVLAMVVSATALGITGHDAAAATIGATGGISIVAGALLRGRDLFPKSVPPEETEPSEAPAALEPPAPKPRPNRPYQRSKR